MPFKPDTTVIIQPEVRSRFDWVPRDLRMAKRMADGGTLALAADLCESMLGDDRISGVFESRISALTGRDVAFEAAGDRRKGKRVAKALEVEEDWWQLLPEDQLGLLVKWGRLLGVGVGQLVTAEDEGTGRWLPRLEVWHPRFLHFSTQDGWSLDVGDGVGRTRRVPITPGDGQWVLYTPYGPTRPWAHGLWRGLSLWWLLKNCAMADWGRHSEVASKGVITAPLGTTREQRRELAQDIMEAGKEAVIALPPAFDYKLVETSADGATMYGAQIQMAHTSFAVAVLGNNLSTEVQGGSLAAASAHADVSLSHTRADAETLSTTAHDQILSWWADWNFGDKALAPWPVWDVEPPEDQAAKAAMFVSLAGALPTLVGIGADARAILEAFDVPLARRARGEEEQSGAPSVVLAPNDLARILRVNEGRASAGLGELLLPSGARDPDGDLTIEEFSAKKAGAAMGPPSPFGAQLPVGQVRLASGAVIAKSSPFVAGQDYADQVIDVGTARAADVVAPAVDVVLSLVHSASSLDELRDSVLEAYSELDPTELALLLERAFILADLAGRYAAQREL